jgi:hypothetical protein
MIGKIIGAIAGERLSRNVGGVGGTGGALLGVGAATLARRLGPVGLVAAAVGGYVIKKHYEKREGGKLG